jgi:hypothetical protein
MDQGTPQPPLFITRIIWLGLLGGMLTYSGVILLLSADFGEPVPEMAQTFPLIGAGMLVVGVPVGYFIRMQIYKKNWKEDAIAPGGYFTGNLVLWAIIEGATIASLTGCLVSQALWPCFIPAIVGMGLMVINFPTGRPLQPVKPGLAQ